MDELDILTLIVAAFLVWVVFKYYWLRILFCLTLLFAWGAFAIGAPVALGFHQYQQGSPVAAVVTILMGCFLGAFWLVGAYGAYQWCKTQKAAKGGIWQPWNSE
jgi:thiol:disulfide interchange protein